MSDPAHTARSAPPPAGIELADVVKTFEHGRLRALDHVDLVVDPGDLVAVVGPSGCGKSTLLSAVAALEPVDAGRVVVAGRDLGDGAPLDQFRARTVGLVFQLDNLLPSLTARENLEVALLGSLPRRARRARAEELLEFVDMSDRAGARPPELSGGERQRVAVARALANRPPVVLADEPTGRLDSRTGARVLDLLTALNVEHGTTVVVVTHDPRVAARARRVVHMLDGRVVDGAGPAGGA